MSMNASDFSFDQIGPSAETIQAAIDAGFIPSPAPATTTAPAPAPTPAPAPITEESLTSLRESLAQIGPTAETIQAAIDAGFIGPEFTPISPGGGGGNGNRNGDGTGNGAGEGTEGEGGDETLARTRGSALNTIRAALSIYGLESLADVVYNNYTQKLVDIDNADAVIFSIRNEDVYKRRFAANEARLKAGLYELDPESYMAMEDSYKNVLSANGMPQGFYDSPDDFKAFIEGDVSASELQDRIKNGYRMVAEADPAVKQKMFELYGVSESQLAAYFIDPERTRPLLVASDYQRQARAAEIAARAQEQAGIRLTGALAEDLARRGTTGVEAQKGFEEIGKLGELAQTFAGEQAIATEDIVRAQFGIDVQTQQRLERRKRERMGEFLGGGGFSRTTGETSGSIISGVGRAQ
jgi:hypothetical protein